MNVQFKTDTWAGKIFSLGKDVFEKSSNKEIAELVYCANHGIVSRERKAVAEKTGWKLPSGRNDTAQTTDPAPAKRKQSGSLPSKVEGFLVGLVNEVPNVWEPSHVHTVIEEDSISWNRFIRRMADLDASMIESFERWLGRGATLSRQSLFDAAVETAAKWDRKARAEAIALELIELGFGNKSPAALVRELWV